MTDHTGAQRTVDIASFLEIDDIAASALISLQIPPPPASATYFYRSYKVMKRHQNAHAIVNAGEKN